MYHNIKNGVIFTPFLLFLHHRCGNNKKMVQYCVSFFVIFIPRVRKYHFPISNIINLLNVGIPYISLNTQLCQDNRLDTKFKKKKIIYNNRGIVAFSVLYKSLCMLPIYQGERVWILFRIHSLIRTLCETGGVNFEFVFYGLS